MPSSRPRARATSRRCSEGSGPGTCPGGPTAALLPSAPRRLSWRSGQRGRPEALAFSRLDVDVRRALVNGEVGTVTLRDGGCSRSRGFTIQHRRIVEMNIIADLEQLSRLDLMISIYRQATRMIFPSVVRRERAHPHVASGQKHRTSPCHNGDPTACTGGALEAFAVESHGYPRAMPTGSAPPSTVGLEPSRRRSPAAAGRHCGWARWLDPPDGRTAGAALPPRAVAGRSSRR